MATTDNTVEGFVKRRQGWMRSYLWGISFWLGAMIVRDSFPDNRHLGNFAALVSVMGAILWGTAVWRITQLSRRLQQNGPLASALGDELFQMNRLKAGLFAFAALTATQGLLLGTFSLLPHLFPSLVVAEINLLVACTSFVGAWLYLDQKE